MPFAIQERDRVLYLTLDTPGCAVNIFNRTTAEQLVTILGRVQPKTTRAVVFRTAKPTSFINGVGLLLSTTADSFDDALDASAPMRAAYRAVLETPVPTVAVVEGMCWGCGVEFLLHTRHRLAADTYDTQFRMTEVADYHDMPVFGSTELLPQQLGLPDAADLLLWGARWGARDAYARGLVDALAPVDRLELCVERFVDSVLDGRLASALDRRPPFRPEWEALIAYYRARVAAFPPRYQLARQRVLELLESAARTGFHAERLVEVRRFAESTLQAKNAYGFFHIRQAAALRAAPPPARVPAEVRLTFEDGDIAPASLRDEILARQPLAGVRVTLSNDAEPWARFRSPDSPQSDGVMVALEFAAETRRPGPALYRPSRGFASRFVELREQERGELAMLAAYLQRIGYQVAVSRGGTRLGTSLLIARFLSPLVAAVLGGESTANVECTLRGFGILRPVSESLAGMPPDRLAEAVKPHLPSTASEASVRDAIAQLMIPSAWEVGEERPHLVEAMLVSLLAGVLDNLGGVGFDHPSAVDLAAQEVLDFPLHLRSLCGLLTPTRVGEALASRETLAPYVAEVDLERARAFAGGSRRFYR
jgi:enoyl-CoA hydratase/carnithine racemase